MLVAWETMAKEFPNVWASLSAIGQITAAIVSIGAWIFVGMQIRATNRSSDLHSLQELQRTITEREKDLISSLTMEEKNRSFVEFLNCLEMYAGAINRSLLHGISRDIAREKICDSIAVIESIPEWHPKIAEATTTANTFRELTCFLSKPPNRKLLKNARRALSTALTSSAGQSLS